jgi:hypothetical protein
MVEDGLTLPMACPEPSNKSFSAFTIPLYLASRDGCLDLACRILGVWALGPKLWFQWVEVTNAKLSSRLLPSPLTSSMIDFLEFEVPVMFITRFDI